MNRNKGNHRIHFPMDDIERARKEGFLQIWKPGHYWAEWKIGNRIILNDNEFKLDRFQMRLTEIHRVIWRKESGNLKVSSRFVMEKIDETT